MSGQGKLIFFCGKMGSGKSTLALKKAEEPHTVLISEDAWLSALYPGEIQNFADYLKYSSRMKPLIMEHVRSLVRVGLTVVMDFPGNTESQRRWFKGIVSAGELPNTLIYLQASDQLCLERIAERRKEHPNRARFDTEEMFHEVTKYFEPPKPEEGFDVEIVEVE